ncbi:unnamed protein product [Ascophyllum nodosum]
MSFLRNMPCRNADNFRLLLEGSKEAASLGVSRRQAGSVVEYIALNDTRPPAGQVIGMCRGHSMFGHTSQQPTTPPTPPLEKRGLKRPTPSGPEELPWATHDSATTSQTKHAEADACGAESNEMSTDSRHETGRQHPPEAGPDPEHHFGSRRRIPTSAARRQEEDPWAVNSESSDMADTEAEAGRKRGGGRAGWLECGRDVNSEGDNGVHAFGTRNRAGKPKARRTYGR